MSYCEIIGMSISKKSYIKKEKIGEGSYGSVFLGEYNGNDYALKYNNKDYFNNNFLREMSILKLVHNNDYNVVCCEDIIQDKNSIICVMKYYDCDLDDVLVNGDMECFCYDNTMKQLLISLTYLHKNNIIHRDIKPNNFLIKDDEIFISDFSISKIICENEIAGNYNSFNTFNDKYKAPEVKKNENFSFPADIWALGIVFLEIYFNQKIHIKEINTYTKILKKINFITDYNIKKLILEMLNPHKYKRKTGEELLKKYFNYNENFEKVLSIKSYDDNDLMENDEIEDFYEFIDEFEIKNDITINQAKKYMSVIDDCYPRFAIILASMIHEPEEPNIEYEDEYREEHLNMIKELDYCVY